MDKRELARVNARILNAEKRYGKDSAIVQRVYDTINRLYGTEGKTRYTLLPRDATFREKAKIQRGIEMVEQSPYFSKEGRQKMKEKSMQTFAKGHNYSDAQIEKLYDFFQQSVNWDKIKELAGEGYSEQVIDAIMNALDDDGSISTNDIDNMFDDFIRLPDDNRADAFVDFINNYASGNI